MLEAILLSSRFLILTSSKKAVKSTLKSSISRYSAVRIRSTSCEHLPAAGDVESEIYWDIEASYSSIDNIGRMPCGSLYPATSFGGRVSDV